MRAPGGWGRVVGILVPLPEGSNLTHTPSAGRTRSLFALERRYAIGLACLFSLLVMLGLAGRASALNYVYDSNQDYWAVNDAAVPGLDTGSIIDRDRARCRDTAASACRSTAPPRPRS